MSGKRLGGPPAATALSTPLRRSFNQMSKFPFLLDKYAIRFPSAETEGKISCAEPSVRRCISPIATPSRRSTGWLHRLLFSLRLVNTMRPPAAEGYISRAEPNVSRSAGPAARRVPWEKRTCHRFAVSPLPAVNRSESPFHTGGPGLGGQA